LVDCDDSDCLLDFACGGSVPSLTTLTETICNDDVDNDGDGLVDCDDSDCSSYPGCTTKPNRELTAEERVEINIIFSGVAEDLRESYENAKILEDKSRDPVTINSYKLLLYYIAELAGFLDALARDSSIEGIKTDTVKGAVMHIQNSIEDLHAQVADISTAEDLGGIKEERP